MASSYETYAKDGITSQLGLDSALYMENQRILAATNPKKFAEERIKAIETVRKIVDDAFRGFLEKYAKLQYAPDVAKRLAMDDAMALYQREMLLVDRQYPIHMADTSSRVIRDSAIADTERITHAMNTMAGPGSIEKRWKPRGYGRSKGKWGKKH